MRIVGLVSNLSLSTILKVYKDHTVKIMVISSAGCTFNIYRAIKWLTGRPEQTSLSCNLSSVFITMYLALTVQSNLRTKVR